MVFQGLAKMAFIIGLAFMLMWTVLGTHMFLNAYANPEKKAYITINQHNEANTEFWILLLTMPCVLYSITSIARRNLNEK